MHLPGSRHIEIYFIAILIHVPRHVSNSPGTQDPCSFGYNDICVNNVSYNFGDKVTRQKREFTISCIDQQHNQELIADCAWQNSGDLACDTAKGYTCQKQLDNSVSVITTDVSACAACKEIEFDIIGEDPVQCTLPPKNSDTADYRNELNSHDSTTKTIAKEKPLDIYPQEDTAQSTNDTRHGVKKCITGNCSQTEDIFGTQEAEDGVHGGLGGGAFAAIVIVTLLTLIGIAAAVFCKRRKKFGFIRKKRPTKGTPYSPADSQNKINEAENFLKHQLPVEMECMEITKISSSELARAPA